jgi:polyphosphate kinase
MKLNPFINRELSWIEFNARVLSEALDPALPPLERLKFISIVSSNFDEFFMVRVASLKRQAAQTGAEHDRPDPSGMRPEEQLAAISARAREVIADQYAALTGEILPALAREGLRVLRPRDYSAEQRAYLDGYFEREVFALLSPVRLEAVGELPPVGNLRLHAAFLLDDPEADAPVLALIQVPASLPRFVALPTAEGEESLALIEDVILEHGQALCVGRRIRERACFRLTRDADFSVDEERDEDFVSAMEEVLVERESSNPVRLSVEGPRGRIASILLERFGLGEDDLYCLPGPLDLRSMMALAIRPGWQRLRNPAWPPAPSRELPPEVPIHDAIRAGDALLCLPYQSFDPVIRFIEEAADDPDVLAIKMTLYRTSGDSPIVKALERAARRGKQVTAVVELKARFDEDRNIAWAGRLERAGAIVIRGVVNLKVHAKAAMIIRREAEGVRPYLHLSTGNYNDRTARLYSDISLFTADAETCYEASLFFNAITGVSEMRPGRRLVAAPFHLKARLIEMIEREASRGSQEYPGLIMAKMNALTDPDVIRALYRASQAGVQVRLNVRGICALRPGVPGLSDNISVVSIVDRFLEHARILYFANGGAAELYLSSADWMERNLDKRIELLFPVRGERCRAEALAILETYFRDDQNAHVLGPDGSWTRRRPIAGSEPCRAQEALYRRFKGIADAMAAEPSPMLEVRRGRRARD